MPLNSPESRLKEIAEASDGTVQLHEETTRPSGYRQFEISIRFDGLKCVEDGLPVRAREPFRVIVPPTFPFQPSLQSRHRTFASLVSITYCGGSTPAYTGVPADWRPEDGMYGFIKRLDAWVRDAALNNLDPDDAPLHPPVEYYTVHRLVVPIADTPLVADSPWFGLAELRERNQSHRDHRLERRPRPGMAGPLRACNSPACRLCLSNTPRLSTHS